MAPAPTEAIRKIKDCALDMKNCTPNPSEKLRQARRSIVGWVRRHDILSTVVAAFALQELSWWVALSFVQPFARLIHGLAL